MTKATEFTPEDKTPFYTIERRDIRRGDIFYIDRYGDTDGSVQNNGRPAIIVSNDRNNTTSTIFEVVYLTTAPKKDLPTHVTIRSAYKPSTALCEQINTVSINRIGNYIGHCTEDEIRALGIALCVSLDIDTGESARKAQRNEEAATRKPEQARAETATQAESASLMKSLLEERAMKEIYKKLYQEELCKRLKSPV